MVAVLFVLINLGGGVVAAFSGEALHAGIHAGLALLGQVVVWRLAPRRVATS